MISDFQKDTYVIAAQGAANLWDFKIEDPNEIANPSL